MIDTQGSIILASGSPRRKDLLEEAGFDFRVVPPEVEEIEDGTIPIRIVTAENASLKATAVATRYPEAVIIAADTLVLLGDRVLSKPATREEAREMLESLNGNSHQVFTAVTLVQQARDKTHSFTVATGVHFKKLTRAERDAYHERIDPMDKAGAYAAQEHGSMIIERIEGSMSNVIGLPMAEVVDALANEFGIFPGGNGAD